MARDPLPGTGITRLQKTWITSKRSFDSGVKAIEEARDAHGDLSENAIRCCQGAQAFTEKKIYEIEPAAGNSEIIGYLRLPDRIRWGLAPW